MSQRLHYSFDQLEDRDKTGSERLENRTDALFKRRINTRSATGRDSREPIGRLFSCVLLGTLSPDPWDLALWARGRYRGEGDVV
jgi:hypothetical protein